jgi:hypothetical protein
LTKTAAQGRVAYVSGSGFFFNHNFLPQGVHVPSSVIICVPDISPVGALHVHHLSNACFFKKNVLDSSDFVSTSMFSKPFQPRGKY